MKLLEKIYVMMMVIVIPTAIIMSLLVFVFTRNSLQNAIANQQLELAHQTMDKIDRLLYERSNDLLSISHEAAIENFLKELDRNDENETPIISPTLKKRLQELMVTTGPWESLYLVNKSGTIFSDELNNPGQKENKIQSHNQKIFEKALLGEIGFSDVFRDPETDKPTIAFSAPVRSIDDPKSRILGVIIGHLSWRAILEILLSTNSHTVELFNKDGMWIGDNRVINLNRVLTEDLSHNQSVQKAKQKAEGSEVVKRVDSDQETLASFVLEKGFLSYTGNDWILVIETPAEIAFSQANRSALFLLAIFVPLLILLMLFIIIFLYKVIIKPIYALTLITQGISRGDFSKRVTINSADEIGQLGTAFNEMSDKLQDFYLKLEEKVKEKTNQLAEKVKEVELEKAKDEAILSSIGDATIVVDKESNILVLNNAAGKLLNLQESEVKGKPLVKVLSLYTQEAKKVPKEQMPTSVALYTRKKVNEVFEYHQEDGTKLFLQVTATPVLENRKTIGAIMICRDVTKEKEIDRMKTEFISLASHQLRTPLTAIKWLTEMLLNGKAGSLTKMQEDLAKNISESTQRMILLVGSLLNISKIESGRIILDPQPTKLNDLIQGVMNDVKAKLEEKKQNLTIEVENNLPEINIDQRLIRQVYMNLLTNAIKYTPEHGNISLTIYKEENEIISQIKDNGYGIPKKDQPKLFQKFFRADNVLKVETDGTGLGLYLIKAIVNSSGGKIWFESEEGKGTTFWFSLPLKR